MPNVEAQRRLTRRTGCGSGPADGSSAVAATCYACRLQALELWIPHDLPEMLIGILEIASVASPECLLSRFHDARPSRRSLQHHRVYLIPRRDIVAQ